MRKIGILLLGIILAAMLGMTACSKKDTSSSQPSLTIVTEAPADESPAQESSAPDTDAASAPETTASTADNPAETVSSAAAPQKEYKHYTFRNDKYYQQHFEKHGSEFGSITKEEYLQLANDLLNSDSDTVLHKTEKEDGDDVFFDTATGYFLVLSTDGYIRTFFIPSKGIDYFNRQ